MICLKELRLQNKMSQQKLSSILGVSRSTIAMWESGSSQPDHETIVRIADLFNVSTDYLLGREPLLRPNRIKELRMKNQWDETILAALMHVAPETVQQWESGLLTPNKAELSALSKLFHVSIDYLLCLETSSPAWPKVPILGSVAAGTPAEAVENIIGYEEIAPSLASTGEFFGLLVGGDSMEPKISKGDLVIVRKQDDAETGDIAVVLVNGNDATIKRIKKTPEGIMLIPSNPAYEPMFYSNEQILSLPVTIIGKVVELHAKI